MISKERLLEALAAYKRDFTIYHWKDEQYKWEAVKCFQDNWDLQAKDFAAMLRRSLNGTYNLLASMNNFPRKMMLSFAEQAPEVVRAAFAFLFDESKDLIERIECFKTQANKLLTEYVNSDKQHYQSENAISVYLWLRYPDKYYIYKFSEVKAVAKYLLSNYVFKMGACAQNLRNSLSLYNEICAALWQDTELKEMLSSHVEDSCYSDPEMKTLTADIGYYISRDHLKQAEKATYLSEIIESLEILGRKGSLNDIFSVMQERDKLSSIKTNPTWKSAVRATIQAHASETQSYKEGNSDLFYSVEGLGKGVWGLRSTQRREDNASELSVAQWLELISDREVFTTDSLIIMRRMLDIGGEATSKQLAEKYGENCNYYNRVSSELAKRIVRKTNYIVQDEDNRLSNPWSMLYIGRQASSNEHASSIWKLRDNLRTALEQTDLSAYPLSSINQHEPYSKEEFLRDVHMSSENFDTLCTLLKIKKNLILQGAPGVGKTHSAKRLAYALMGEKDNSRIQFVQFHQNYSYEDFVVGYKPYDNGFKLTDGIFYSFCNKAAEDSSHDYFFIIDEINRGNMSKIFGELLMLIENNYRDIPITLAYTSKPFYVPENLYIIGMMNTADRSLAMIDYALRRRFSFFDMKPAFDTESFVSYQAEFENDTFDALIECIKELNRKISKDPALGDGFCIGHSYFCNQKECTEDWMKAIAFYSILPMLREYWFDDPATIDVWESRLSGVFE